MIELNKLRILLLTLCVGIALAARGAGPGVENFAASSGVPSDKLALLVVDLSDGHTVASLNETSPLVPASIMKSVTTASLLSKVGPDYRYRTRVYTVGRIRDGVLDGDLVVVGSGDPSLNSTAFPDSPDFLGEITGALRNKGVEKICGNIVVDESVFSGPAVPSSWASGDLSQSYGTGSHGFNFRGNASGKRSVSDPAGVFRTALTSALASAGIMLEKGDGSKGNRQLLVEHLSPPADEIMRSCMMRSDNLFAESMLRTYAAERGEDGSTARGASLETDFWKRKKLPMKGVEIIDGSGLSRSNRVTALFMSEVLRHMAADVTYASFFPLAGQEGTLRNFLKDTPLDSYIAMKTGSMKGIQCYAGYKLDDDYAPTHAVVVMANDMPDRGRMRAALQRLLLTLFSDNPSQE